MIVDRTNRLKDYQFLGKYFRIAAKFVEETDLESLSTGRHEIDGENVFANVVDRELNKVPTMWEMHRKYADIHLIVHGSERIGYFPIERLKEELPFDEANDCSVIENQKGSFIDLYEGDFLIALPQDVHLTNYPIIPDTLTKKVILKVRLDD